MNSKRQTQLSIILLATLLIGAFTINSIMAPTEKKLYYFWYPYKTSLDEAPPEPWNAYIWGVSSGRVRDINPATMRLEGLYSPTSTKLILWNLIMIAYFHGYDVVQAIMVKLPHMGPGTYKVSLEITGNLKDGSPFRGSATITVTTPDPPPP
jgi:hypothetical protein